MEGEGGVASGRTDFSTSSYFVSPLSLHEQGPPTPTNHGTLVGSALVFPHYRQTSEGRGAATEGGTFMGTANPNPAGRGDDYCLFLYSLI